MKQICERMWEIDALQEGRLGDVDAASFERHRAACEECRQAFLDNARLRELGQAMPSPKDDPLHARRLRARILRKAAAPRPDRAPGTKWAYVAAALVASALTVVAFARHGSALRFAQLATTVAPMGSISAGADTVWSRSVDGEIERVRLERGSLLLQVRHRTPTERFLVDLPDGQLEVRGTRFDVSVRDRRTQRVHVLEGTVELRLDGAPERVLVADETWSALPGDGVPPPPAPAAPDLPPAQSPPVLLVAPSVATPSVGPPVASVSPSAPAATVSRDRTYEDAIDVYRAKNYDAAAVRFRSFVIEHPSAPEAEDAAFLEASSMARAGQADAAALVAEHFLVRYPKSIHARDAATLVVRSARATGDCDKARRTVAQWLGGTSEAEQRMVLSPCPK